MPGDMPDARWEVVVDTDKPSERRSSRHVDASEAVEMAPRSVMLLRRSG
jgi:hypothetical protein